MMSSSWGCSLSLLEVWARHDEHFCDIMSSHQCGLFYQHISCLSQTRFGRNLIPVPPLLSNLCNAQGFLLHCNELEDWVLGSCSSQGDDKQLHSQTTV